MRGEVELSGLGAPIGLTKRRRFMRGLNFLMLFAALVLVDGLVPYLLLRHIPRFTGAYLFWCLLTLGMILFAVFCTRRWGKSS
jgi:ABC-type branched-subunit amino acid transport system permease subunit